MTTSRSFARAMLKAVGPGTSADLLASLAEGHLHYDDTPLPVTPRCAVDLVTANRVDDAVAIVRRLTHPGAAQAVFRADTRKTVRKAAAIRMGDNVGDLADEAFRLAIDTKAWKLALTVGPHADPQLVWDWLTELTIAPDSPHRDALLDLAVLVCDPGYLAQRRQTMCWLLSEAFLATVARHADPDDAFRLDLDLFGEHLFTAPLRHEHRRFLTHSVVAEAMDAYAATQDIETLFSQISDRWTNLHEHVRVWALGWLYRGRGGLGPGALTRFAATLRREETLREHNYRDFVAMLSASPSLQVNAEAIVWLRRVRSRPVGATCSRFVPRMTGPALTEVGRWARSDSPLEPQFARALVAAGMDDIEIRATAVGHSHFEYLHTLDELAGRLTADMPTDGLLARAVEVDRDVRRWPAALIDHALTSESRRDREVREALTFGPDELERVRVWRLERLVANSGAKSQRTGSRVDELCALMPLTDEAVVELTSASAPWTDALLSDRVRSRLTCSQLRQLAVVKPEDAVKAALRETDIDRRLALIGDGQVDDGGYNTVGVALVQLLEMLHPDQPEVWKTAVGLAESWHGTYRELVATAAELSAAA